MGCVILCVSSAVAGIRKVESGWEVSTGDLVLTLSTNGSIVSVNEHGRLHKGKGGAFVIDARAARAGAGVGTGRPVSTALGLDPEALENYVDMRDLLKRKAPVLLRSFSLANIDAHAYAFKIVLTEPFQRKDGSTLMVYCDTDANPDTGRKDKRAGNRGQDLWLVVDEGREPYTVIFDKAGKRGRGTTPLLRIRDNVIYLIYEAGFLQSDEGYLGKVFISARQDGKNDSMSFEFRKLLPLPDPAKVRVTVEDTTPGPAKAAQVSSSLKDGKLVIARKPADAKATIRSLIETRADRIMWTVRVVNQETEDGFYKIGISLPVAYASPWWYWDGYAQPAHADPKAQTGIAYVSGAVFPMGCVYSRGRGMAVALEPFQMVAAQESYISPAGAGTSTLSYGTPVVIAPGKEFSVQFALFPFKEKRGYLDAVQRYQRLFPDAFRARAGTNARCAGMEYMSIYYRYAYDPERTDFQGEIMRRVSRGRGGWEWLYRPGIYPGDWGLLDPDRLSSRYFEPGQQPFTHDPQGAGPTFDAYKKRIRMKCTGGERFLVAPGFYMNFVWCGEELAEKMFPDSLIDAKNNPKHRLDEKWWKDFKNDRLINSKYVYASGTSWGEFSRNSIRNVVQAFAPSAICFDSASGAERIYGPVVAKATVRTFDSALRPYSLQAVAFAGLMDFTRTLRNERGEQVAVIPNWHQSGAFPVAFRSDTLLLERHPLQWQSWEAIYPQLKRYRMIAGQKTITMNRSYSPKLFRRYKWAEMDAQQTLDAFREIRDETLLCCAQFGILPGAPLICGTEKLYNAMPLLHDLAAAGWQPSPKASVSNQKLQLSRFGTGAGGFFVLTNHHKAEERTVLTADLSEGRHVVLANNDGRSLTNRIFPNGTQIEATVKGRSYAAFTKVAVIHGLPHGTTISASHTEVPFKQRTVTFDMEMPHAQPLKWTLSMPIGYGSGHMTVGNKTADLSSRRETSLDVVPSQPRLRPMLVLEPEIKVEGDIHCLHDVDFLADPAPACISLGADYDDTKHNYSAWRIREYFRYYASWVLKRENPVTLNILRNGAAQATSFSIVLTPLPTGAPGRIRIAAKQVVISGDTTTLPKAVLKLLEILDQKYPYYGTFICSSADWVETKAAKEILSKAGLMGKVLKGEIGEALE